MDDQSEYLFKEPCPACGSRDNLARYSDGHGFCFGCRHYDPAPDGEPTQQRRGKPVSDELLSGEIIGIPSRGLSEETCRRYDYRVGSTKGGKRCHIANYRDQNGSVVAQHLRLKDKEFPWVGSKKNLQLFGQHTARDGAAKVIITEGEIDAMSLYEVIGNRNRWAYVSIASGAKGAAKDIAANLPWLEKAEEVVLMFDMDEVGREASDECVRLFRPGKCKIAQLPLKDANEMLMAGRGAEIVDAIFQAKEFRPDGVVRLSDIKEDVLKLPTTGFPWWHDGITKATFGRRLGELDAVGAGTGVGKTDFLTQQIEYDICKLGMKVGLFFLEQQPTETARRLAGKMVGRKFHIPPSEENPWTTEELAAAIELLDKTQCLYMYDHFGVADYAIIEDTIRYLYHSEGVTMFYLDHLTALASSADDERKELELIMGKLGGLVKELNIWVCIVSHLATPDGKPHEEGGRVMIRHFKGSRSIGFWCHHMFGLERNQQSDDEEDRQTTVFRVLKDRVTGQSTGKTFELGYDHVAGRLFDKQENGFGPDEGASMF
jgi:twinkle protein